MFDVLFKLASFLVVTGILVAWHEYGHFWMARRFGIKVIRFAVGFGPNIWQRTGSDGVEYTVKAVPLGGYVKFADTRDGSAEEIDWPRAFDRQAIWKRACVIAAGPIANLILAVVAFTLMFTGGREDLRPILGDVTGIAQQSGLRRGDEIITIQNSPVSDLSTLFTELTTSAYDRQSISLGVRSIYQPDVTRSVQVDLAKLPENFDETGVLEGLGMGTYARNPDLVITQLDRASGAGLAGAELKDRVTAVNGQPVKHFKDFVETLQTQGNLSKGNVRLTLERNGVTRDVQMQARQDFTRKCQDVDYCWRADLGMENYLTTRKLGLAEAFVAGNVHALDMCRNMLKVIKSLLLGQASTKNISGPITIAEVAGNAVKAGWVVFFEVLGAISLSLFIMNLLPVPVLDGGQLVFLTIEKLKGSPPSERLMQAGAMLGILIILGLMALAIGNDISRHFIQG
jgi:regulator of sigma E protease